MTPNLVFCPECEEFYSEGFFKVHHYIDSEEFDARQAILFADLGTRMRVPARKPICIGCIQNRGDEIKRKDRSIKKAERCFRHHCKTLYDFNDTGRKLAEPGIAPKKLRTFYGWETDRIAHIFRHAFDNTCCYCCFPYKTMEHGFADVTLDVINREAPPFLRTNTTPCCRTCNTTKGQLTPLQWELRLIDWKKWRANHMRRSADGDKFALV